MEFKTAVDDKARQLVNNEMIWLIMIPGVILSHVVRDFGFIFAIAFIALSFGAAKVVVDKNKVFDDEIRGLCDKFSSETGRTIQYYTQYTGLCKPKHAQTMRAIVICSSSPATIGAVVGPPVATGTTTMSVQVPPGVQAGQTLQIQTASGPMNVVVPQGVAEGGTFQVQVPAAPIPTVQATPVIVQAAPVQATPVAAEPSQVQPTVDEDNPNMEVDPNSKAAETKAPADGFFCPIHGRFPGQNFCPKCNPPQAN